MREIFTHQQDIFDSGMQTLVCPVNCVGVMGKGLALQFKETVPGLFQAYRRACMKGALDIRRLWMYSCPDVPYQVLCFPTKGHWKYNSRISDIERNLKTLAASYKEMGITSLAIPPVGCGCGKLDWVSVQELIRSHLGEMDIEVRIVVPPR